MKNLIVMPKSKFLRVMCNKCRNDQIIYNRASTVVKCLKCGEVLAEPTGGEILLRGKFLEAFG